MHYPSAGLSERGQIANENYSGAVVAGLHALVDDTDMYKETWEWINLKEVEKLLGASHPDPLEIEKAQQMLEKHEQALIDAIANLDDAYDGERV
ncbi:protein EMSY-LIKE 3-like isoform X2 [Musa acuminata AAA Group]|uniref:protein EMSY-LIKE 3-like isoform X2 n=1 Tax=Musa acuminata AAA Group TaxID=214697 RepID=UPI0031DF55FC